MKLNMPINMLATMLAIAALIACVTIREIYVRAHPPAEAAVMNVNP